jgi:hypothetical protein
MHLPRKTLCVVTFAGALLGTPALASVRVPMAPGGVSHPPLNLATLPSRLRVRRRGRGAKRRVIAWWNDLRARDASRTTRARSERLRPRLAPHDSYPRGPPRPSGG